MTEMRFGGDVVIVTGAGRGLGRAYALYLAERGARVVVNDISAQSAEDAVAAIRTAGGVSVSASGDIVAPGGAQAIVETALSNFGQVNAVINNAGFATRLRPFCEISGEDVGRMMAVHATGSWEMSRAVWPHFVKQGSGRLLLTSAGAFYLGTMGNAAYNMAKGAVFSLMRSLAVEGADAGIRVNGISPSGWTTMWTDTGFKKDLWAEMEKRFPVSAVAPVAAYLVHADCPINGELVEAMGGRVGRVFVTLAPGVTTDVDNISMEFVRDNLASILSGENGVPAPMNDL